MMYQMNRMTGPLEPEGRNIQRDSMLMKNENMENVTTRRMQPPAANQPATNPNNIPATSTQPSMGNQGNIPSTPTQPSIGNQGNIPSTPTQPSIGNQGNIPSTPTQPSIGNQGNIPSTPTQPSIGNQGNIPSTPTQPSINPPHTPVVPLPPFVGNPPHIPVVPLPPFVGNPDIVPVAPLPPFVGTPPLRPQPQPPVENGYSTVRFLHAIAGAGPVNVSVGIRPAANRLSYGEFSGYGRVQDGYYSVTVTDSANPNMTIFKGRIPFNAEEKITLAIVKEGNGYNLIRISDQQCNNRPAARGCVRAANLIYNSPPVDVIMTDGRIAFPDVRYKEVTFSKQAWPGEYDFYVAQTAYSPAADILDIDVLNNLPVVLVNFILPGFGEVTPLVSSYITVRAGGNYTIYMLGDWLSQSILIRVDEN